MPESSPADDRGPGRDEAVSSTAARSRRAVLLGLAGLPGILLTIAALGGLAPTLRDLHGYFVPLRAHTAAVLSGHGSVLRTTAVGCGEPYFANPQTGILYPLTWLALIMPAWQAVGVEAGLHIALLGVGSLLLALRLGAREWMALAGAWAVVLAGPIADTVGVLNNLETLAWMPWIWHAALGGSVPATAGLLALAYLGAEPQLAAIAAVVAVALAPRRRTVAAVLLGAGLVAVQALPFLAWVSGGDRGPGRALDVICAGALTIGDIPALVAPGALLPEYVGRFLANPTMPLWVLLLGAAAVLTGDRRVRTLAVSGWLLLALAVVPSLSWGRELWATLTLGLVRYPSRLVFPAVVMLAPAAAAGLRTGRRTVLLGVIAGVTALGLAAGSAASVAETTLQALVAASCGVAPLAPWAALTGALALGPRDVSHLGLERTASAPDVPCLAPQREQPGRLFTVQLTRTQFAWAEKSPRVRGDALGWGYVALEDGREMVRTFGPLASRRLAEHLAEADRGPAGRWWLDALAAPWLQAHHELHGFPVVCRDDGLVLARNPNAWQEVSVVRAIPAPGSPPEPAGVVLAATTREDRWSRHVKLDRDGVLLWSATPDPGWRFEVDGQPVGARSGPGILQGIPVDAGEHTVTARYRPPGLLPGGLISLASVVLLVLPRGRRRPGVSPPVSRPVPTS